MTELFSYHKPQTTNHKSSLLSSHSNNRIEYIDIFRAFGIILMVMGHIGFGGKFDYFIHAFHMPMFFFVSGIFFRPADNFLSFTKRKFNTLLIPYICFGTLHYILWLINHRQKINFLSPLLALITVNTYDLPVAGALWFLTSLFFTEIIYSALFKLIRSSFIRNVIIILLASLGHAAYYFLPFNLFWGMSASLTGLVLYHAGFIFSKYIHTFRLTLTNTIISGIITTVLIFINGYVNLRVGIYGFVLLYYLNAFASFIAGMSIAKIIHEKLPSKIDSYLQGIGKNSVVYLCLNQIVILAVHKTITHNRYIVLFISLILLGILSIIFSRTFLRSFIGKSSKAWHNNFAVIICVLSLVISVSGVFYANENNKYKYSPKVYIPEWKNMNTDYYSESESLRKIIALNLKYIINTQWNSPQQYALSGSSSTKYPLKLSGPEKGSISRSAESFKNWRDEDYIFIADVPGKIAGENAIRPLAHICFILASALRFNLYDESITGISREDAEKMTCKLIASLSKIHCSNSYSHNGWGNAWQSALWSENIAFAGWLMWDSISEIDREYIINMLIYESNRFIDYEVPYYSDKNGHVNFPNDTKAEENAWNSRILALSVCMLPEHENNSKWESKLTELLLSSTAAPENINSDMLIDGVILWDILKGSNIGNDGTVMNHGLYHIDYMTTTIEGMTDTVIIYALSGKNIPASSVFNHDLIYSSLVNLDLGKYDKEKSGRHFYERDENGNPGRNLNMPGQNDWGGKWFTSCYLADTEAEIFSLDKECPEGLKASDWSKIHLDEISEMIQRSEDGKIFAEGENYFVSGETYAAQNLCKAYMLRKLKSDGRIIFRFRK